jgi:hypothetical protein
MLCYWNCLSNTVYMNYDQKFPGLGHYNNSRLTSVTDLFQVRPHRSSQTWKRLCNPRLVMLASDARDAAWIPTVSFLLDHNHNHNLRLLPWLSELHSCLLWSDLEGPYVQIKVKQSHYRPMGPRGFWELESGRLSAIRTGRLYPQGYPGTHFKRLSPDATEKIPSDITGDRSRDLRTSSAVPYPVRYPRPPCVQIGNKIWQETVSCLYLQLKCVSSIEW